MSQIFLQYRAVQRADGLNVQSGSLFKDSLYLRAVFADNADIIAAGFVIPVFLHIQGAELSEAVCGEEYFVCAVICHHNFRPVNHRSKHKSQLMASKR